jgi:hypothetical protein
VHTPHDRYAAPSRHAPYTGRETYPRWLRRAYTTEPRRYPDDPILRFADGHFWLDVFNDWARRMRTPLVPSALLGRADNDWLTVVEFRRELLEPATGIEIRDRAWRWVVQRVRDSAYSWHYFAVGLAVPGLKNRAFAIAPYRLKLPPPYIATVHRALVTEFVLAMHRADLDEPNVIARLLGQAEDAARGHPRREPPKHRHGEFEEHAMADLVAPDPTRHLGTAKTDRERFSVGEAYLALRGLVRRTNSPLWTGRDRLTTEDARLIAYTYLEGHTLHTVAPWFGLTLSGAHARRDAAKKTIARLTGHDD